MGIKNLLKLLRKNDCIETRPGTDLRGNKIAVDVSLYVHKYIYGTIKSITQDPMFLQTLDSLTKEQFIEKFEDKVYEETARAIIRYFHSLRKKFDIKFEFVFDGKGPEVKKDERERRDKQRQGIRNKLNDDENDVENFIKYIPYSFSINHAKFNPLLRQLLEDKGFSTKQAEGEAERDCCIGYKNGTYDGILTLDTDCIAMGCDIIMNINSLSFEITNRNKFMKINSITDDKQFLDYCIMLGCDYNTNMYGIGPVRALRLIRKHGSIEKIPIEDDKKECLNVDICRNLFTIDQEVSTTS